MTATTPATPATEPARPRARSVELILAHAHLRLGSLSLARVELETMAGMGLLDTLGIVDLAEVRWRTGDLLGAGEAAGAALSSDDRIPVALVIAAEAASALGRPTEARRLADQAMQRAGNAIDAIFAGMPRSTIWPADAAEPPPTAPTLFDREPEPLVMAAGTMPGHDRPATDRQPALATPAPLTLGLWDEAGVTDDASDLRPDPAAELEAGRAALVDGDLDGAALHFSLALRLAPALAPAILEATDGVRDAGLILVRGDAYRMAGHETEAQAAFAVAALGGLPERRSVPRGPARASATAASDDDDPEAGPTSGDAEAETEAGAADPSTDAIADAPSLVLNLDDEIDAATSEPTEPAAAATDGTNGAATASTSAPATDGTKSARGRAAATSPVPETPPAEDEGAAKPAAADGAKD